MPGIPFLEVKNITKKFPGVVALNKVSFAVNKGEILGIIGENGAGKSTVVKILGGIYQPDEGKILFQGKNVVLKNVQSAQKSGISLILQESNLVPNLDVAHNIFLGKEPVKNGLFKIIDKTSLYEKALTLLKKIDLNIPLSLLVKDLSPGQKQLVEILKALSTSSKIIIMDEPTTSLTKKDTRTLFSIIRELKSMGISIIYISHRIEEVLEITDRIICLRDGQKVGELKTENANRNILIKMMIGREINEFFPESHKKSKNVIFEIKELKLKDSPYTINFKLHSGEILGIAGLVGSGRTEIIETIFGIREKKQGKFFLDNNQIDINSPVDAINFGIGFVPEDRQLKGLILNLAIKENITLPYLKNISKFGIVNGNEQKSIARSITKKLNIKSTSINQTVVNLSGGNQQKIVLGKWLTLKPKILILDEPTKGIDVGAKAEIYRMIHNLAEEGVGVIFISSELEEIIGICDRVIVICEKELRGELLKDEFSEEKIMQIATGGK